MLRGDPLVLIVDDNAPNRQLLRALISSLGVERIDEAEDGIQGLEAMQRRRPDLVLLDVMMPRMDGYEMCRRLREIWPRTELPVIFVTALDSPTERSACFAAGATDMVSKPINAAEVAARVGVHLENRALLADLQAYQDRIGHELEAARQVQMALLPTRARTLALGQRLDMVIDGTIHTSSELGGDFWTVLDLGYGRAGVLVVDFAGHGVPAALQVFQLNALLSRLGPEQTEDPLAMMAALNAELAAVLSPGQYATAFYGVVNIATSMLRYVAAASPDPLLIDRGVARPLDASGPLLGAFEDAQYDLIEIPFPAGAALLLYSDALVEAQADGKPVVEEAELREWAVTAHAKRADIASAVLDRFQRRLVGAPPDDLTLVSLRRM
ncbi:MAG: PP2C family protein-serine/threonine phosphatase [Actinomycetota bacterium]